MRWARALLPALLAVLCVSAVAESTERSEIEHPSELLPTTGTLPGWEREAPSVYLPDTLYEAVNGAAPLYLSYGFQELAQVGYVSDQASGESIEVSIYTMDSPTGAFGLYASRRRASDHVESIGTEGVRSPNTIAAWKGRFYVDVIAERATPENSAAMETLAQAIFAAIPGEDRYPPILKRLPPENRVPHTERYTAKDYLGYTFLQNAVSGLYHVGSSTATVFIACATDTARATEVYTDLVKTLGERVESHAPQHVDFGDGFVAEVRYMGKVAAGRTGRFVYGAVAENEEASWGDLATLMHRTRRHLAE